MSAIPAGFGYRGGMGVVSTQTMRVVSPTVVSRMGAGIRESIADSYLASAGLGHRGGVNGYALARSPRLGRLGDACTDDGAVAARAAIGGGGAGFATMAQGTGDQGWQTAGGIVEGLTGAVSAVWGSICQAQAARAAGTMTPDTTTASALATMQAQLAAAQSAQSLQAAQAAQRERQAAQASQRQTQMLLIGGGVIAAVVIGVLVLRR